MVTDAQQQPGWGWAAQLVWYLEEQNVLGSPAVLVQPIHAPQFDTVRITPLAVYTCASDPTDTVFELPIAGYATTFTGSASLSPSPDPPATPPQLSGAAVYQLARANYAGLYGTTAVEQARTRATESCSATVTCDLPKSSTDCRKLCSLARIFAPWRHHLDRRDAGGNRRHDTGRRTGEHVPNDVLGDLATFGSYHIAGVQFLYGAVRYISSPTRSTWQLSRIFVHAPAVEQVAVGRVVPVTVVPVTVVPATVVPATVVRVAMDGAPKVRAVLIPARKKATTDQWDQCSVRNSAELTRTSRRVNRELHLGETPAAFHSPGQVTGPRSWPAPANDLHLRARLKPGVPPV